MSLTETTRFMTTAETAKLVRQALKPAFPDVKFSVRSRNYAGGSSIDVYWTDGPSEREVERVTDLYVGATFDGQDDCKTYHESLLSAPDGEVESVRFGADFIFTHRNV